MAPVDTDLPQQGGPHTRPNEPSEGVLSPGSAPTGPPIAPSTHGRVPPSSELPPGVHPMDSTAPDEWTLGKEKGGAPYKKGRQPFSESNGDAFGVFQRSAHDYRAGVTAVNANSGGTAQVVGRLPGRRSVTLWIPAQVLVGGALLTPPNGVIWAATEGEMQGGGGAFLGIGDAVTIESEASVFIGLVPATVVGYVQYLDLFDAPGGGITGNT